jgi:hypothetical protein
VDKAVLYLKARELNLLPKNYKNCEDIDAGVESLVRWNKETVAQHIPSSKPVSFSVAWWSNDAYPACEKCEKGKEVVHKMPMC